MAFVCDPFHTLEDKEGTRRDEEGGRRAKRGGAPAWSDWKVGMGEAEDSAGDPWSLGQVAAAARAERTLATTSADQ